MTDDGARTFCDQVRCLEFDGFGKEIAGPLAGAQQGLDLLS
ncbi:MAG: hypothetical protein NT154_29595 [Verrucomicrobia bacterium]|nr:hypothetical protein [Verrucomicrobiota bacterium]